MPILLLAPAEGRSGAAHYNRAMVAALHAQDGRSALLALSGSYPAAMADPVDVARIAALPDGLCLVLDGIALALAGALPRGALAAVLVHRPSALQACAGDSRDALARTERDGLARVGRVVAASTGVAERLQTDYAVPTEHLRVVPPGAPALARQAIRTQPPCRILSIGPLVARRRHDLLLRACARLFDLDWELTLAGDMARDPDHAAVLRGLGHELGIADRLTFVAEAEEAQWRAADLLALAHPVPGMEGVLHAALCRGIPLALASTQKGLCPPGAGALCEPGDADALSRLLRRMVFDVALRRRMADLAFDAGAALPSWETQAALFRRAVAP